jgi:hypothetical protein
MTPINPTTPPATPPNANGTPAPAVDLLAEPTDEECTEQWNRYYDDVKAGRIDLRGIPEGHYIAYYNGRIHGHDPDSIALQRRVAAALGVHWARVFIHYPWMW